MTSYTERMAQVFTDETNGVARSETDSEQNSTSVLAVNVGSHLTLEIQRLRGRMSGSLFLVMGWRNVF